MTIYDLHAQQQIVFSLVGMHDNHLYRGLCNAGVAKDCHVLLFGNLEMVTERGQQIEYTLRQVTRQCGSY